MSTRWLGLVALAACGGATVAGGPVAPKEAPVDPQAAEKGAKDLVGEIFEDIGHANTDSLQALLDTKLMVLGPRKTDAVASRADAIIALGKYVDTKTKKHPNLKMGALGIVSSEGGHSAWGFDQINANGEPWAVMVVMSGLNDLWTVDAVALAEMPPMLKVKTELKKDAVVPPAANVTLKADAGAAGAVEKFQKGLFEQDKWFADLELTDRGIVVGPSAGDITRGKKDIKALSKRRMKANVRAVLAGEISGATTRDGQLAWVSAPITRAEDNEEPMPLRAFAVFQRAGATWNMVALQESLSLDQPGAGTPFKKPVPAAAPPPPPPEKVKKKDDKDETKKTKKKKKMSDEDTDEQPKKLKKKTDDDEAPKKLKKKSDDEDAPKKLAKKKVDDDVDDAPKKKKKKVDDDADDGAAPKKKKGRAFADDEDNEPKKLKKKKADDADADDAPKKKKAKADDDDAPKKVKKKKADDDADEAPKKKKKADDTADDDAPKKKKAKADDDGDDQPKKKKKKADDDDVTATDE